MKINRILIMCYSCSIAYGIIMQWLDYSYGIIAAGILLLALIIQDWRENESKSTFR